MQLRELLLIDGSNRRGKSHAQDYGRAWDVTNEIPYTGASAAAFVSGLISQSFLDQLKRFNSIRNAMIHKLLYEPYEKKYPGVPYSEYVAAFNLGMKLESQLQEFVHKTMGTPSNTSLERGRDR